MKTMAVAPGVQAMIDRDFPSDDHPYRILERAILRHVDFDYTVLDVGCGRTAPNLIQLKGRARTLIGIDLVKFGITDPDLLLVKADVCNMNAVATSSVDLAYSRSVMEHIKNIQIAYSEINRVLKPGGKYIVLTPNAWDYTSIIAYLVPNRFHAKIMHMTLGRAETEVFPTFYKSNTFWRIRKIAEASNFALEHFEYLGQYPYYFTFSKPLFRIAAAYEKLLRKHRHLHCLRGWIFYIMSKRVRMERAEAGC
jgi:SAM-dependent methyltransferase